MNKLFIYGTLRDGREPTHRLPGYIMFAARGKTFNFPYIQKYPWNDNPPQIIGNVIEVSDDQLKQLDHYENVARGLYTRETVVVYQMGKAVAAPETVMAYIAGPALASPIIESGHWPM